VALHTDESRLRAPDEYMNHPLNRCARLMATAHGGQVLLSDATKAVTRGRPPEGADHWQPSHTHRPIWRGQGP